MSVHDDQRALRVCRTCRTRKKGCDKTLPACGYCSERSLSCNYDVLSPSYTNDATTQDLAALRITEASTITVNTATQFSPTSMYDFVRVGQAVALDAVLGVEVLHISELAGISAREVCEQFFDGFHRWLPVISAERFREIDLDFRDQPPKADLAVLLLAIYLVTLRPQGVPQQSFACLRTLYQSVRINFTRVQAIVCGSTFLIQAGIIIAAYEYACRRPGTAHVSIGACTRMLSIAGTNSHNMPQHTSDGATRSTVQAEDEQNMQTAVTIMERLIFVEVVYPGHDSVTQFSNNTPPAVGLFQKAHAISEPSVAHLESGCLLAPKHISASTDFGRGVEASDLLNATLRLRIIPKTENARSRALVDLDTQLHTFSTLIMGEFRTPGPHCLANATVIRYTLESSSETMSGIGVKSNAIHRSFFLLHQGILEQHRQNINEATAFYKDSCSWAALDAAARMMAAVASHHVEHVANLDVLPVSAAYVAQIATQHIEARQKHVGSDWASLLETLRSMTGAFHRRWPLNGTYAPAMPCDD